MASTGFGRMTRGNRIPYYKLRSSRTYRGVKTGRMVADMSTRLAKAQDTQMKNEYQAGTISLDQYNAYLAQRIGQTSDPVYRNQLTTEVQNNTTAAQEGDMINQYNAGNISGAEVANYYQSKLAGLNPDNPLYSKTQADVTKWNRTASKDSYKLQEATLKEQYMASQDKLGPAQKLLDYNIHFLQTLSPQDPEYETTLQNIGTYQQEVQKLTSQQQLLAAEDQIAKTYNKGTPEDLTAKSQMYAALRDQAAQSGDIPNYYKYDRLAQDSQQQAQTALTHEQTKQITTEMNQIHADYLSGKIDGATAQGLAQQVSDQADQIGDPSGIIVAHDFYNKIQNDIAHGVQYGADNGFGKVKGGSGGGDTGWFDGSTGLPVSGGYGGGSTGGGSGSSRGGSGSSTSSTQVTKGSQTISQASSTTSLTTVTPTDVQAVFTAAKYLNPSPELVANTKQQLESGVSPATAVIYTRALKVGTGDGWQALQQAQQHDTKELNTNLSQGYDPISGQAFGPGDYWAALRANDSSYAPLYASWQNVAENNPKMKISINGKNTTVGSLADNIDKTLNGTTKTDPETGLVTKDSPGMLDIIGKIPDPQTDPQGFQNFIQNNPIVEDAKHPGTFMPVDKAAFEQTNGSLSTNYLQDQQGVYHYINQPKPIPTYFQDQKSAQAFAKEHNIPAGSVSQGNDGRYVVYTPNAQERSVSIYQTDGKKIDYVLSPDNKITGIKGVPNLPQGYRPSGILSTNDLGKELGLYRLNQAGKNTPQFGMPSSGVSGQGQNNGNFVPLPSNQPVKLNNANGTPKLSLTNNATPSSPIVAPTPFVNPIDQLVSNIFKNNNFVPAKNIPSNTPLNPSPQLNQSVQSFRSTQPQPSGVQQPQQNPASPSTSLQNVGLPPQNNFGSLGGGHAIPAPNIPQPQSNPIQNFANNVVGGIGNAAKSLWSGVSNFFGGFHF